MTFGRGRTDIFFSGSEAIEIVVKEKVVSTENIQAYMMFRKRLLT